MLRTSPPVCLHDVRDVDAYVGSVVRSLHLTLTICEREELCAEGVAVLYGLADTWNGRDSFAGYASSLIDRRLISAWHELAGHSRRRTPTGRRWVTPTVSLDAELQRPGFSERQLSRMSDFRRVPVV